MDDSLSSAWRRLRTEWFPERTDLDQYQIVWSRRPQLRTLASCNIHRRRVVVARELNYPEHKVWLDPLLYHEMCHAFLGIPEGPEHQRRAWHGKDFRNVEQRHPGIGNLDAWIKSGGWRRAIRSDRSKRAHRTRHPDDR